jgi:hypothetical protein
VTDEEAMHQLGLECPRRIMGLLHAKGHCLHCTSARFPGKVLCFHKDSELPADAVLTPAQAHFSQPASSGGHGATA